MTPSPGPLVLLCLGLGLSSGLEPVLQRTVVEEAVSLTREDTGEATTQSPLVSLLVCQ